MKDRQIEKIIKAERKRQKETVNLIASENFVSKDVLTALGSEFTNKYAEGYPAHRYYGGNKYSDQIEKLCKKRALKLFGLKESEWTANVQPLSGSPANLAVYFALLPPVGAEQGKIMGLELSHGGHLSHGFKASATGKLWKQIPYGVDRKTEQLNYEELAKIAEKEKPGIVVAGFTAYPRVIDWKKMKEVAKRANAFLHADISHIAGLIAAGEYPSPFAFADTVMTTTHKTLRGPRSAIIFSRIDGRKINEKIDRAVFPGLQGGPHLNQIAAVAVALYEDSKPEFKKYIKQMLKNAEILAEELFSLGWRIVSGVTDTHLVLIGTWKDGSGLGGKEASNRLEREGIIVNKNTIPYDERNPSDPSGIRLGTAAETTRGKKEKDMIDIARRIDKILRK